jgi:hypothetical protein
MAIFLCQLALFESQSWKIGQGKCVRVYGRQGKQVYRKYFYGFGKQNAALT